MPSPLGSLCNEIVSGNIAGVQKILEINVAICNHYDQVGRSPLHLACMCSSPEITRYLVEQGASPSSRMLHGQTAFHIAAARGSTEILGALLGSEQRSIPQVAEVDEANLHNLHPSEPRNVKNQYNGVPMPDMNPPKGIGFTPLHLTILHGHVEIVDNLVNFFGSDINAPRRLPRPECDSKSAVELRG